MKNAMSKTSLLAFGLMLLLLPSLVSCKKDKKPAFREEIVGEWVLTSFTVNGVEAIGSVVSSSKMEFEKYTGSNGDFEWSIIYTDGSSEIQRGDYAMDEEDKEIVMESDEGERLKFDFDLDKDDLELSGTIGGKRFVLQAERE